MGTSFNNQWVLARARSRHRERAAASAGVGSAGPASQEQQGACDSSPPAELREPRAKRHAGPPAFTVRHVRKNPRWIDRDT
ncbi:MAG: hypothetical protein ACTHL7_02685 [Steroidobacteraceae bacterium]